MVRTFNGGTIAVWLAVMPGTSRFNPGWPAFLNRKCTTVAGEAPDFFASSFGAPPSGGIPFIIKQGSRLKAELRTF